MNTLDIVEPLDHRIFPKRLVHIHRPGIDARRLNTQLPPVAGFGQRDVADARKKSWDGRQIDEILAI